MKHVFVIHSNITRLVAFKVVKYLNIEIPDIIFCLDRNFQMSDADGNINCVILNDVPNMSSSFITNIKAIRCWKVQFENLINDDFIAYIPHTHNLKFILMVESSKCKAFSYIEEGLASYLQRNFVVNRVSIKKKIKSVIYYGSFFITRCLLESGYFLLNDRKLQNFYALSVDSFPDQKNRILLDIGEKLAKEIGKYDCLIIFDALSIFELLPSEQIIQILEQFIIPRVKEGDYLKIAYKLHPEHLRSSKGYDEANLIRRILKQNFTLIEELPLEFNIEGYMQKFKVDVFSYFSSLGYYAVIMNSKSFSVGRRLAKINPKLELPACVLDKIIQI